MFNIFIFYIYRQSLQSRNISKSIKKSNNNPSIAGNHQSQENTNETELNNNKPNLNQNQANSNERSEAEKIVDQINSKFELILDCPKQPMVSFSNLVQNIETKEQFPMENSPIGENKSAEIIIPEFVDKCEKPNEDSSEIVISSKTPLSVAPKIQNINAPVLSLENQMV